MASKKRRPSAFVPRMFFGTVAVGVLPVLATEACNDEMDIALAIVAFDASNDAPVQFGLAVASFDAADDVATSDASTDANDDAGDASDASDDGPDGM